MRFQPMLAWHLACKDVRLFLTDRRAALLSFVVPILLASVFGAVFHRSNSGELIRPAVRIVNDDDSPLARNVVKVLRDGGKLEASESDRVTALADLNDRRVATVLILPLGFGKRDARPCVEILHHPGSVMESHWVEGVFTETALRESARELAAPLQAVGVPVSLERPFTVDRKPVAGAEGRTFNTYSHSFCGMTLQYLLFWGMDSGLLLLRERRQGIWRRLRCAPLSLTTLLAGKTLATSSIALAQIAVVFGFGWLVFGVTVNGSLGGFLLLAVAAALLSATTGLLVAAVGGNEGRARSVAILTILVFSMLGGLWLPSFLMPAWARQLALALPTTWAAQGFEGVTWQGLGWNGAVRCAGVVAGFCLLFLMIAFLGLARAETRRTEGGRA